MSFDTSRGVIPCPAGTRGAPGRSVLSGGTAGASLTAVSRPVFRSSASVITIPVISVSTYANLLSLETTMCRGPWPAFSCTSGGVFAVSLPVFASKRN